MCYFLLNRQNARETMCVERGWPMTAPWRVVATECGRCERLFVQAVDVSNGK